jgi:bacterioferritin-associated ferredoxin
MKIVLKIWPVFTDKGVSFKEVGVMYVCLCKGVVENQIRELVAEGVCGVRDVQRACLAGSDCGACIQAIRQLLTEETKNK